MKKLIKQKDKVKKRKNKKGQALIEYILLLVVSLFFARVVFFNPEFGFYGILERTMLRLGVHLEQDLKTGAQSGAQGENSMDGFAGSNSTWEN